MIKIFLRDGIITGLHDETIPLMSLGTLSIKRASTIEFDAIRQKWVVALPNGEEIFSHSLRKECLNFEKQFFENLMTSGRA